MALRISFKPGMAQSQCAARYFQGSVEGLVDAVIDGLQEHDYLIGAGRGASLRLRVWSATALDEEGLHELFEWMLAMRADVQSLQEAPRDGEQLAPLVTNWLSPHLDAAQLFVELSIVHPEVGEEARPEFALGLMRGRCVMISTDNLLFTFLEEGIFGLSVAGHGSYLLEVMDGGDTSTRQWRRAS